MKIGTQLKQWLVLSLALMTVTAVQAFEPVTGVWSDTGEGQRRTGYSIEFQNGFMLMSIYSYADNNASTNPTWYNTEGFLTKNEDGSLSGTFPLYTVANNQLPNAEGNVPAGNMTIRFTDRETATVTWNNFPGNRLAQSTLKKYWFIGTGTDATAKRYAARGLWQYSLVNIDDRNENYVFRAVLSEFSESNILLGEVLDYDNVPAIKEIHADGVDVSLMRFGNADIYIFEVGGGTEYSAGIGAFVGVNEAVTNNDLRYFSTAVRRVGVDQRDGSGIAKSADLNSSELNSSEATLTVADDETALQMSALLDAAMNPELIKAVKEKLNN